MPRLLIANRGEIAVRVIRACATLGYTSLAVYADQDAEAMHTELADEAYALPGTTPSDTYLNIDALISVAQQASADAIHPGYGFLSENADFAEAVEKAGITWIGPTAETITTLGDKVAARKVAERVGAPLVPGIDRPLTDASEVQTFASEHGLPIIIKAAHGGGGRGMKIVRCEEHIAEAFATATREAEEAFGRGECFVEKFLERPRHVEVQVLGDGHGHVVAIGDRDCSAQRRNQKLVEEAPAPNLTQKQRELLHRAAENICAEVRYRSAGTVEFLLAADGTMTFLEVNTRLQVEHPVTEETTGVDLVAEQLHLAVGEGLTVHRTPEPRGHAIELRINAEDPGRGFLPTPGTITSLHVPGGRGVRWDSGIRAGNTVQPQFDSLCAKLIVHAENRQAAIARARAAARELHITGVATALPASVAILENPDFCGSEFRIHTQWIEDELLATCDMQDRPAPISEEGIERFSIEINGHRTTLGLPLRLLAAIGAAGGGVSGAATAANITGRSGIRTGGDGDDDSDAASQMGDSGDVVAPMPGNLVEFRVEDGAEVNAGDVIAVLSAMKMEDQVLATTSGICTHIATAGDALNEGDVIATIA